MEQSNITDRPIVAMLQLPCRNCGHFHIADLRDHSKVIFLQVANMLWMHA